MPSDVVANVRGLAQLPGHFATTYLQVGPRKLLCSPHCAAFPQAFLTTPFIFVQELQTMLVAQDPQLHYGVDVSLIELAHHQASIAENTLLHPDELLPLLDDALVLAQERVLLEQADSAEAKAWAVKVRIVLRCTHSHVCVRTRFRTGATGAVPLKFLTPWQSRCLRNCVLGVP
jgi:hypothetical protein